MCSIRHRLDVSDQAEEEAVVSFGSKAELHQQASTSLTPAEHPDWFLTLRKPDVTAFQMALRPESPELLITMPSFQRVTRSILHVRQIRS